MKQLVKKFNNLITKTIFKVENKTNNKLLISKFNKYLITFISLLFFYLFYLSIPVLYDKNWVQKNVENLLLEEFKTHFSFSSDISYRILPSPHYLVKDSKILKKDNKTVSLATIKTLKVFISQKNFFDKKKLSLRYIILYNSDFTLLPNDLKLLRNNTNSKISNKKIEINKSNIFFKNDLDEIISIIKISQGLLFYDEENLLNLLNFKGEAFNKPFNFNYNRKFDSLGSEEISVIIKALKLDIFNIYNFEKNNTGKGKNIISFLNSKIDTNYKFENDIIIFKSTKSKIKKTKIIYNGELSIDPFGLNLNIDWNNHDIYKFFNHDSILNTLIKTKLLFNKNISVNVSLTTGPNLKDKFFQKKEFFLILLIKK